MHPQMGMQGPPKKSNLGLILGLGAGVLLLGIVLVVGIWAYSHMRRGSLPLEASKLPTETREIGTRAIPAARESNDKIKKIFLASELSGMYCSGRHDPASRLESITVWGSKTAKEFFEPTNLDNVRGELECGTQLATTLDDPHESYLAFDDPDTKSASSSGPGKLHVTIGHFKMKAPPASEGFTSVSFGSLAGFCQTTVPTYASSGFGLTPPTPGTPPPTPTTKSCDDKSQAAFAVNNTWFFGNKSALDELSKGIAVPKTTLGTRVAALQDAFNETSNLTQVGLEAEPKSSKEYLEYPCRFAASELGIHWSSSSSTTGTGSLGSTTGTTASDSGAIKSRDDFMQACFPGKQDSKLIEEIDAKLRAIGFETDPDYVTSGAVAGNLILVTRDAESAKDAQRAINELVSDWKAQIELNAPKLIKAGKDQASTLAERKFAAVADTYFQALSLMKVSTSGRTVKISFKAAFTKEDQQELKDEDSSSNDKRVPVAEILEAIRDKKPIPQASLAKLVGASWAAYLVLPPLPPTPPSVKVKLTTEECSSIKTRLMKVQLSDLPITGDSHTAYFEQRYASCDYRPPEVSSSQKPCLATFTTAAEYAACTGGDASDPRQPPESEFGKLK
jgi:hypothetical protein